MGLQPLRMPTGWRIDWNTLFEEDPTEPANAAGYYHHVTDLFFATHASRRRAIDIEWRTEEEQPTVGRYLLRVHRMVEADESKLPRRSEANELEVSWDDPVREFETQSRLELVAELEAWLAGSGGRN